MRILTALLLLSALPAADRGIQGPQPASEAQVTRSQLTGVTDDRARYARGRLASISLQKAAGDLRQRAEQGDAAAQYEFAQALWNGQGVPENDLEAVKWFRLSAEQGYVPAERELGLIYGGRQVIYHLFGSGPRQDLKEAAKWYRRAPEHGDAKAQLDLAVFYWNGHGVRQSWSEGTKWLGLAAESGNTTAQDKLSWAYFSAKGVPRNDVEAYKWLDIAIALGEADRTVSVQTKQERLEGLQVITKSLKPAQIGDAQRLAREWRAAFELRKK